jgi:hypothetical protein
MPPGRPPQHALADRAVNAFERQILDLGWVWNPTRSGSDYGIDGFLTPIDELGRVHAFEIPIQVKGVARLERRGSRGTTNPVTREAVDILRTHILGGYFVIYDDEVGELYYCSADDLGTQFDRKGGKRKRLQIPLENVLNKESLLDLRNDAEAAHDRLAALLRDRTLHEAAQRLYLALAKVQTGLFEFVAAIGMFDQANLMRIYAGWGEGMARERRKHADDLGKQVTEFLAKTSEDMSEYEVEPPTALLGNFPAPTLIVTSMRWIIVEVDEFVASLPDESSHIAEDLGLAGLRSIVRAALDRSFSTSDGAKLPLTEKSAGIYWMRIHAGHYFLSTTQVALVVNRLMHELRAVLFPSIESEPGRAPRVWIRHRSHEEGFVRSTSG